MKLLLAKDGGLVSGERFQTFVVMIQTLVKKVIHFPNARRRCPLF